MTEKAISPLRRRLIEDMAIHRLGPKTQHQYIRHVKRFAHFSGPVCRQGHPRGCPSLSVVAGVDRDDGTDRQRRGHCPAVLLQGHTEAPQSCRGGRLDPRAPPPARRSEPGRGRSAARLGDKHQAQGALEPGLCHRPASLGGRIAQAHRHRQRPEGHPGRSGQGQEGSFSSCCANGGGSRARRDGCLPVSPGRFPATAGST
jgi:hypothetical protein